MCNSHLRDGVSDDESDDCAEEIRKDDAWPSEPDRDGAAEKKPDSDRTPDGHHGELALRERASELWRTIGRAGGIGSRMRLGESILFIALEPCQGVPSRTRESRRWCCSERGMRD